MFSWHNYSKKSVEKIMNPRFFGSFTAEDAKQRSMHFVKARMGSISEGNLLVFYWLVDPSDGIIVDCKYQLFGDAILIAIAESTSEFLIRKNYDQAKRVSGELIEKVLEGSFASHTNFAIDLIDLCVEQCVGLPLPENYTTPIAEDKAERKSYPGWSSLSKFEKLKVIDALFTEEIRPYIELDEGGVKILDLVNECEVMIAYEGACTSCYSSVGTTLSSIQNILQMKIDPSLKVVPNLEALTFK